MLAVRTAGGKRPRSADMEIIETRCCRAAARHIKSRPSNRRHTGLVLVTIRERGFGGESRERLFVPLTASRDREFAKSFRRKAGRFCKFLIAIPTSPAEPSARAEPHAIRPVAAARIPRPEPSAPTENLWDGGNEGAENLLRNRRIRYRPPGAAQQKRPTCLRTP